MGGIEAECDRGSPVAGDIAVLVCTKNRPKDVERLLRSLVEDAGTTAPIVIVDQSDNGDTAQVVSDAGSPRVCYVKSQTVGKGAAMNEGMLLMEAEFVVCTDDDCEAPVGWVAGMAAALRDHPRAAVVFCKVKAPPHDRALGYVPDYVPRRDRVIRRAMVSCAHRGLGAGMALRRSAILALGGIDETFGPGARFGSGDDWDVQVRVLMNGWETFETNRVEIVHHGFRTYAEGRAHGARDWYSLGAVAAKPVRAGHPTLALMALYIVVADGLFEVVMNLYRFHRPNGARRLVTFCRGFRHGLMTPVDQATMSYSQAGSPATS